jgi:hypothetical protein
MKNTIEIASLTLRFDRNLKRQIERAAKVGERSLNGEIIYRLRQSFDAEERDVNLMSA